MTPSSVKASSSLCGSLPALVGVDPEIASGIAYTGMRNGLATGEVHYCNEKGDAMFSQARRHAYSEALRVFIAPKTRWHGDIITVLPWETKTKP